MFKRTALNALRSGAKVRQFHSTHVKNPTKRSTALVSVALIGTTMVYMGSRDVHNDVSSENRVKDTGLGEAALSKDQETLHSLVWGSNRSKVLSPTAKYDETIRSPSVALWLEGVALLDLQLQERYGACVDAKGDVYQWGDGFFGDFIPDQSGRGLKLTLKGKNIVQLQLTENKIYALSASGHIYVFASKAVDQVLQTGAPTASSDSWWGTGWLWGEDQSIDYAMLESNDKLDWGERFTSIAAGKDHVLALTSKGRTFAHPINKQANAYGQLGFRKFAIPDPAAHITGKLGDPHLHVELTPKSLTDPFSKASRSVRVTSPTAPLDNLANINDSSIRFCPFIYELPVLRGVEVSQIAAGSRSSFARTSNGRVLGWGANEYGQLGLGSNITLDTIIVPTEAVLWRTTPGSVTSTCTNVSAGGDLVGFVVDRKSEQEPEYTELLMAGNGQYGGLGNNTFSTAQSNPTHVKPVSGLHQYNDRTKHLDPIKPDDLSISPTGHVMVALDSAADSEGVGGSDVMIWGRNFDSELGNGKKSSVASPLLLEVPQGERLMLMTKKAKEVKDLRGKTWKCGINVEQRVETGYGNSLVYWKIVDKRCGRQKASSN